MPSGYIIANVSVTNPQQYEDYKKWSTEAFRVHGKGKAQEQGDRAHGGVRRFAFGQTYPAIPLAA